MTADDQPVLVCFRVASAPCRPVLGAVQRWCRQCNKAVWVSPSGLKMIQEGFAVVCLECAPEDAVVRPPTPEQIKEIVEDGRALQ